MSASLHQLPTFYYCCSWKIVKIAEWRRAKKHCMCGRKNKRPKLMMLYTYMCIHIYTTMCFYISTTFLLWRSFFVYTYMAGLLRRKLQIICHLVESDSRAASWPPQKQIQRTWPASINIKNLEGIHAMLISQMMVRAAHNMPAFGRHKLGSGHKLSAINRLWKMYFKESAFHKSARYFITVKELSKQNKIYGD